MTPIPQPAIAAVLDHWIARALTAEAQRDDLTRRNAELVGKLAAAHMRIAELERRAS